MTPPSLSAIGPASPESSLQSLPLRCFLGDRRAAGLPRRRVAILTKEWTKLTTPVAVRAAVDVVELEAMTGIREMDVGKVRDALHRAVGGLAPPGRSLWM